MKQEEVQQQLVQQLKVLTFWLRVLGVSVLISILVAIYLLVRVLVFVQNTRDSLNDLTTNTTEQLDIRSQICDDKDRLALFLKGSTDICDE